MRLERYSSHTPSDLRGSADHYSGFRLLQDFTMADIRRLHPPLGLELVVSNEVDELLRRDADIALRMTAPVQQALVAAPRRVGRAGAVCPRRLPRPPRRARHLRRPAALRPDRLRPGDDRPARPARRRARPLARHVHSARGQSARATGGDPGRLRHRRMPDVHRGARPAAGAVPRRRARSRELSTWVVMHEDLRASPRCRAVFNALADALA